jgi:hypothetical protein
MTIDERNIEIIDDCMAQIFREKTPQERLAIAFGMWKSAKMMLTTYLRSSHPDWDERKIHEEVVKRLSHGTIRLSQTPR